MSFPKQYEIRLPLLAAVKKLGGAAAPKDLYPIVAQSFPNLTEEDLNQTLESSPSTKKWANLVAWVRQSLVEEGMIDGSKRGVWAITKKGEDELIFPNVASSPVHGKTEAAASLRDLTNSNRDEIVTRIKDVLNNMSGHEFEHFCSTFLEKIGYSDLVVTKKSGDGGLDGYGNFKMGIVHLKSAFQAKRWKSNPVGSQEIDQFRGAIQGTFEHGIVLTTSKFSKPAKDISVKHGAVSIHLIDGDEIANTLIRYGLGIKKEPVYTYEIDEEFFLHVKNLNLAT